MKTKDELKVEFAKRVRLNDEAMVSLDVAIDETYGNSQRMKARGRLEGVILRMLNNDSDTKEMSDNDKLDLLSLVVAQLVFEETGALPKADDLICA